MTLGIIFAFFTLISTGCSVFFGKVTTKKFSGIMVAFLCQLIGGFLLIPLFLVITPFFDISIISVLIILGIGILNAIAYINYYQALSVEKASIIGTFTSTNTFVSSIIGIIFFGEILTLSKIISIPIIFLSLLLLLTDIKDIKNISISKSSLFNCLIAILCWGLLFPLLKVSGDYMDANTPIIIGRIISALLILPILNSKDKEQLSNLKARPILASILALSLFNALVFIFYNLAMQKIDISIASQIYACYPVITIILSRIFLNEKISKRNVIGIIGIIIAVILLSINK